MTFLVPVRVRPSVRPSGRLTDRLVCDDDCDDLFPTWHSSLPRGPNVCSDNGKSASAARLSKREERDGQAENAAAGTQFNRNNFGMSFGLKNGLRFHFESGTCDV